MAEKSVKRVAEGEGVKRMTEKSHRVTDITKLQETEKTQKHNEIHVADNSLFNQSLRRNTYCVR